MFSSQVLLARRLIFTVGAGFALALLLMAAITFVALDEMAGINQRLERIVKENNVKSRLANEMREILRDRTVSMHSILVISDEFEKDAEMLRFYSYGESYSNTRTQLASMLTEPEEKATLARLDALTRANQPVMVRLVNLGMEGYTFLAFEVLQNEAIPLQRQLFEELDTLIDIQRSMTQKAANEAAAAYASTRLWLILLGIAAATVSGLVAVVVIQRTAKQAALTDRERTKYLTLFEANTDGIVILDSEGFTDCNPATLSMFRFESVEDFRRMRPEQLGADPQPNGESAKDMATRQIQAAIRTGHSTFEWLARRTDGSQFPAQIMLNAIELDGKPYIQAIMRDVTTQKAAEAAKKAAHDAALATAEMKSQFVANVSHEIRTPMNGIIGMTRLLLSTELDARQHEYAETVARSAHSLLRIINDILDFSKIEAGRLSIEQIAFEPQALLKDVLELYGYRAEEKHLALKLEGMHRLPERVIGDPLRIRQILLNLLDNALKFTEQGEVCLSVQAIGSDSERNWYRFSVRDTGIGIPQPVLDRIFEAFAQADGSTSRKYGGTGLGLTICRQLAELMGGNLTVSSKIGQGSSFHLDLPLSATTEEAPTSPAMALPALRFNQVRVLLAEDNPVNQRLVQYMLENMGIAVELAGNGIEAFDKVKAGGIDLVLMDCQMPEWDGMTASRAIRAWEAEQELPQTPIVALTANAMHGFEQTCRDAGMSDYLTKPILDEALAITLARWLPGKTEEIEPPAGAPDEDMREPAAAMSFDLDKIIRTCKGNVDKVQEMLTVFVDSTAGSIEALRLAHLAEDSARLAREAHQLKGATAFTGAQELYALACRLEQNAKQADWPAIAPDLDALGEAFSRLRAQIRQLPADSLQHPA
ncbi:PAS domain S-box-containing protein [Sulfuritortus calidifontis]|uniref:Sensory/regulatory protein RpfC n=1 Tax=Sulfuritortus calidifontis TaxID=1914471 RepID=A0A4R3JVN4_9PROT|nr:ATP-binding protein [Sulfuritortus calidifontis]TCS70903.1 PAS domain S-box-containing protein [Sulfuritortus calidifontis]